MFAGLTPEICQQAWAIARPSLEAAVEAGVANQLAGALVVLDPWTGEEVFLAEVDPAHPDAEKFVTYARGKARLAWSTGMASLAVRQDAPHLYREGDIKYPGGVVEHRLAVAFSGIQDEFDIALAGSVLRWIVALCQNGMREVMAAKTPYIGGTPTA